MLFKQDGESTASNPVCDDLKMHSTANPTLKHCSCGFALGVALISRKPVRTTMSQEAVGPAPPQIPKHVGISAPRLPTPYLQSRPPHPLKPQAPTEPMDRNTIFELLFGLIAAILALIGLWLTYRYRQGSLVNTDL